MLLVFVRHGGVAVLLLGVAAELLAWLSGLVSLQPAVILVGALLFYLSEYGMHRFAFHAPPLSWPLLRKLQHRLHYDHHVEPNRLDLLFLPLWFLVPNLAIAAGLFALLFGMLAANSALLGMMLAILHYEWVHYVAHIPYQPRTRLGRWIKQYRAFSATPRWMGCSGRSGAPRPPRKLHHAQSLFLMRCRRLHHKRRPFRRPLDNREGWVAAPAMEIGSTRPC